MISHADRLTRLPFLPPIYSDSHTHLDCCSDDDVAAMVRRARLAGVSRIATVGSGVESSRRALALARRHPGHVVAAAGIHPRFSGGLDLDALGRLLRDNAGVVRAVGEIGLDRTGAVPAPLKMQTVAFELQLRLAAEHRLPVIVHAAGAHGQVAAMLRDVRGRLPAVIIHYFTGSRDALDAYLELECLVSFGRLLLKREHAELRAMAAHVPAGLLLAETDSYPLPDRTTEPRDVAPLLRLLARLRGVSVRAMAHTTTDNLDRALGLTSLPPDLPAMLWRLEAAAQKLERHLPAWPRRPRTSRHRPES